MQQLDSMVGAQVEADIQQQYQRAPPCCSGYGTIRHTIPYMVALINGELLASLN